MGLSREEFEGIASEALELIPDDLMRAISNVAIFVEDEAPADSPDVLGLYEGVPLTERDSFWAAGSMPDRIRIFQGPLERAFPDPARLRQEIAVTVVHEVAHHFGIGDTDLHDLGWG